MMRKKRGRALETGKSILIVMLAFSAVYLMLRTQTYTDMAGGDGAWPGTLLDFFGRGTGEAPVAAADETQPIEVRPLRMAVNIAGVGRYGVQYDNAATDKLFGEVFSILGEALGSAKGPEAITEQAWRVALTHRSGIYFDFGGQIPMAALYAWLEAGTGGAAGAENVRQVLLAEDETGGMTLYYNNDATGLYYACRTADTLQGHLQNAVVPYSTGVNRMTFAYEHTRAEGYGALSPYVMLPDVPQMQRGVYRGENPIGGGQTDKERGKMMEALGFHPQSNTSYVAGGKQVVNEGTDTLAVYDSGVVEYHGAATEEPRYPVGEGSRPPTAGELAQVTQRLAEKTVGAWCADARIYLQSITPMGKNVWQVDYGYQLDGAAVQLGDEGYAARFTVTAGRVSDFRMVVRSYTATGEQTPVLPERQAAAALTALGGEKDRLVLVYEDRMSAETVQCGWIAE